LFNQYTKIGAKHKIGEPHAEYNHLRAGTDAMLNLKNEKSPPEMLARRSFGGDALPAQK